MGVKKFFRYISERYPCISELAREQSIPDFDNLYLDMNGIIHNCSHPDDTNFHFSITEEDIFKNILNYINYLFFLIKPQRLFFIAIDGVAPRAKMNQQRSRRFRSAKNAELMEQKAASRGEVRETERFDSNCITPGTEFMSRLHEALKYFIKSKITSDPLWQKCRVILSGHDTPGEGKHKIMDYIRYLKSKADYNPNTRHCLYSLDADLMILGLCTHELHFVGLHEEVKFGKNYKHTSVEEMRFFLLHLSLLREYLELEFGTLRNQGIAFNISKLIDDWVLISLLVGNDFIPYLPYLHISSNALPLLYKTYFKVFGELGGNINENGKLNLKHLEKYFAALSDVEFDLFTKNYTDLNKISNESNDTNLADQLESSRQFSKDDEEIDSSDEALNISAEFEIYKRNFYMTKLNYNETSIENKHEQAVSYITGLQWILDYYYCGVQSWDWYYPHHYAPFISDLKDFSNHKIKFNMGKPFLPFQQLLGVLPAGSKKLLPIAYRELMTSESSELIHFYPNDFETDINGKKTEWEAVVLIPFIDEKLLLRAMKSCESNLTANEVERNAHGPMLQYDHNAEPQCGASDIYSVKALHSSSVLLYFCTETQVWASEIAISAQNFVCIKLPNMPRTVFYPGFRTMKVLKYNFQLQNACVKVFDHPSHSENLILTPFKRPFSSIVHISDFYLNRVVFIGWPHLIKVKIVAISNSDKYIDDNGIKDNDPKLYQLQFKRAEEHLTRMGISFSDFNVLVHVRSYIGPGYLCDSQGKISTKDIWSHAVTAYPAQGVVRNIAVHNALVNQHKKVEQLFPVNSTIIFVGNPYFGSKGTVLNPLMVYECGYLEVKINVLPEPNFSKAKYIQSKLETDYVNSYEAAARIGINAKCLGRVADTMLVVSGMRRDNLPDNIPKFNIGLEIKNSKQQEERAGYARHLKNQWFYSSKAIALVQDYCVKFPMVVDYFNIPLNHNEFCFEGDLFPTRVGDGCVEEIMAWLKVQDYMKVEKIACGSETVEKESVEKILISIEQLKSLPINTVELKVKPHLLLKLDVTLPDIYKAKRPIIPFDRVIVVKTTYMVPLGAKGTVVGIYPVSDSNSVRLDCVKTMDNFLKILFDKHLPNGNDIHGIAQERVYKVLESSVLLIPTQKNKEVKRLVSKIYQLENNNIRNSSTLAVHNSKSHSKSDTNTNITILEPSSSKYSQNQSNDNVLQQAPIKKSGDSNSNASLQPGKILQKPAQKEPTQHAVTAYPAQGVVSVRNIAVHNALVNQHKKVEQLFPVNSTIIFVGNPYFGSEGTVLMVYLCGYLEVKITVLPEPNFSKIKYIQSKLEPDYLNSYEAAARIGINAKCLGRVADTMLVVSGMRRDNLPDNIPKLNIGLEIKNSKQQEECAGYARHLKNQWFYSSKAIALVQDYCVKFPMVVDYFNIPLDHNEFCFEGDLFPTRVGEGCVEEIMAWLKVQDYMKVEKIECGSETVEKESVEKILISIEQLKSLPINTVELNVKPHLLLKLDVTLPDIYKAKRPIIPFDRVIVVKTTYMVPLGAKGTVVGIYPVSDSNSVRLDCVKTMDNFLKILFDKHLPNGNGIHGIAQERVYKVLESSVLLIPTQKNKRVKRLVSEISQLENNNIRNSSTLAVHNSNSHSKSDTNTNIIILEPSSSNYLQNQSNDNVLQQAPIKMSGDSNSNASLKPVKILQKPAQKEPTQLQAETQFLNNILGLTQGMIRQLVTATKPRQFQQLPEQQPPLWRNYAQNSNTSAQSNPYANFPSMQTMQPTPAAAGIRTFGGEFQMPIANTNIIPENISQFYNQNYGNNYNSNSNSSLRPVQILQRAAQKYPTKLQAETHLSENVLGISQNRVTQIVEATNPEPFQQLPQQPALWRNYAQNGNTSAQSKQTLPYPNIPKTQTIQPSPAAAGFQPYAQNAYFLVSQGAQQFFSTDNLNQKGAFIPTQVMRNNTKEPLIVESTIAANLAEFQANLSDITTHASTSGNPFADQRNATIAASPNTRAKSTDVRKKLRRIPKIAAKFNLSYLLN